MMSYTMRTSLLPRSLRARRHVACLSTTAVRDAADTYRIGCASGFWGDTMVSTTQLVHATPAVDVIVSDYLSEITMSLLARMKMKDKSLGYCADFILAHMRPNLATIKRKGIRVVTNAGGLNAEACATALRQLAKKEGVDGLKVATVHGDDMTDWTADRLAALDLRAHLPANVTPEQLGSMNAYFGAQPIQAALDADADIVITGRCVDSALVTGPLMHRFKWTYDDWQALATASLAGHLIECGAQATGGVFTDWDKVANWGTIGFPIAEFDASTAREQFVITKPDKSGGCVTVGTLSEQLIYEIDDPRAYKLPDVTCDFADARMTDLGGDRVLVQGARGRPPPNTFKVTSTYTDGYRCTAAATVIGGRAGDKARKTADAIIARCRMIFKVMKLGDFARVHVQAIGDNDSYGGAHKTPSHAHEVVLWIAVAHASKEALGIFAREIAAAGTGMAPGLCGIAGGRPTVSPVLKHCSFAVPRTMFTATTRMNDATIAEMTFAAQPSVDGESLHTPNEPPPAAALAASSAEQCPLHELAYARSGDKGDTCNIGVIARSAEHYAHLADVLTVDVVTDYFKHMLAEDSVVTRYMLPGTHALNFVLTHSLGGGGVASLRVDPQGKAYAQMLLDMSVRRPAAA